MSYLVRLVFTCVLLLFVQRIVLWLSRYLKLLRVVNKIPGPYPMLPFIGNAHQLKPGSGI